MDTPGNNSYVAAPKQRKRLSMAELLETHKAKTGMIVIDPSNIAQEQGSIDPEKFKVVIDNSLVDEDDIKRYNYAKYNDDTSELTVYVPEYTTFEIDIESFAAYWSRGLREFNLEESYIGTLEIDDAARPTCRYLIPTSKDTASELPTNWRYTSGYQAAMCICPGLNRSTKEPGACNYSPVLVTCSHYNELEPVEVSRIEKEETVQVRVEKSYTYPRLPHWNVSVVEADESHKFESALEADLFIDTLDLQDAEIIDLPPAVEKESYFEAIFGG